MRYQKHQVCADSILFFDCHLEVTCGDGSAHAQFFTQCQNRRFRLCLTAYHEVSSNVADAERPIGADRDANLSLQGPSVLIATEK